MRAPLLRAAALATLLAIPACAPANLFVLLPDENGTVGAIEVSTRGGTQRIERAREATRVASADAAPGTPETLSEQDVADTFAGALRIATREPRSFLLYFETGSDRLTPESQAQLPAILDAIGGYPAPEVAVIGHTDRVGTVGANAALGRRRAEAIRDLLVARGLQLRLIEVTSHGEGNPLVPTADEVDEPRNRRVEVSVR